MESDCRKLTESLERLEEENRQLRQAVKERERIEVEHPAFKITLIFNIFELRGYSDDIHKLD